MAHSFVQCFEDETEAFRAFTRSYPTPVLVVDTYNTARGLRRAVDAARKPAAKGHGLRGVRLDSGDLDALSRTARRLLDEAGFTDATVFASGGIDEYAIDRLLSAGAPIDGFGVGTKMAVAADAPYLDMAYKLVAFDGRPRLKLSEGKATLPGAKQVWRTSTADGPSFDVLDLADRQHEGEPLLVTAMREGRRVWDEPLAASRERALRARHALPPVVRGLDAGEYDVRLGSALADLRDRLTADACAAHRA